MESWTILAATIALQIAFDSGERAVLIDLNSKSVRIVGSGNIL